MSYIKKFIFTFIFILAVNAQAAEDPSGNANKQDLLARSDKHDRTAQMNKVDLGAQSSQRKKRVGAQKKNKIKVRHDKSLDERGRYQDRGLDRRGNLQDHRRDRKEKIQDYRQDKKEHTQDKREQFQKKKRDPKNLKNKSTFKHEANQRSPNKNIRKLKKVNKKPVVKHRNMIKGKRSIKSNQKKYNGGDVQRKPSTRQNKPYRK